MFINNPGHITKMAAMYTHAIYPSNIFSSETGSTEFNETWQVASESKYYNVFKFTCINHDPVMTLTCFMARST